MLRCAPAPLTPQEIVQRMREVGGQFTLETQPGQGTRIEFILPIFQ